MTEKTMKDVSHTPPHGEGANAVWERGDEVPANTNSDDVDVADPSTENGSSPTPADD